MTQRTALIAGNWKMHGALGATRELVSALVAGLGDEAGEKPGLGDGPEMLVCPPFVYLDRVREWIGDARIKLGAQDVAPVAGFGAHTGEISGAMLADVGCRYVIVGHSERRTLYGETDAVVVQKFRAAQAQGIVPILCVGEHLEQREAGETDAVVAAQVNAVVDALGVGALSAAVIAYEPIWAIGTGKTATPDQAQAVHAMIRELVGARDAILAQSLRILYGGSVKGSNAAELLSQQDIDGGLVGGASLDAVDFLAIHAAAAV